MRPVSEDRKNERSQERMKKSLGLFNLWVGVEQHSFEAKKYGGNSNKLVVYISG